MIDAVPEGRLSVGNVKVPGAGAVGVAVNSPVISGDHNTVVVQVSERPVVEVAVPDTVAKLERVLFGPVVEPDLSLVGSWLRPDAGIVDAQPRPEVDTLVDWCTAGRGPVVRLVCGPGGQGKTHLARQVCQKLRAQGWTAGLAVLPSPRWQTVTLQDAARGGVQGDQARRDLQRMAELAAGVRAAAKLQVRTLLVIDYAENTGPLVAELLDIIADADAVRWVRILLLARTDKDWFQELTVEHRWRHWVHPRPMKLGALSQDWDAARMQTVWQQAVERFAHQASRHGFAVPAAISERVKVPRQGFATTLDLYAAALVAVLDAADGQSVVGDPGDRDPMTEVLRHEQHQVTVALHAAGLDLDEEAQAWTVAAVTLTLPATEAEAVDVIGRIPRLAGVPGSDRERLVRVLRGLYPDESRQRIWQAPRPDRLADIHLLKLTDRASSRQQWINDLAAVCGSDDLEAADHTATVLRRCMSTPDSDGLWQDGLQLVRDGLAGLAARFPAAFVPALVQVDPVGFEAEIVAAVEGRNGGLSVPQVEDLDARLQRLGFTTTRARVAVAVSQRLVEATRPDADRDDTAASRYAGALNGLSVRLGWVGRGAEGLAAIEEAVTIRRRLAEENPTAYLPDFATSLNNLSVRLAEAGRRAEALTAIEESVTIRRRLAEENPTAYLPDLAMSLHNLSNRLAEAGRRAEALTAIEESVTIRRRLTKDNPAAYLPNLATSLNNLSNRLAEAGRRAEALTAIEESVTIRRRLTKDNPAAYLPNLATSLNNLSNRLAEVGRPTEGLATIEEAVGIYRRLAEDHPTAYLPDLAGSLNNLSNRLAEVGRPTEGLATIEEAVGIYRRLAESHPTAYLPDLAGSLNNLSARLAETGRHAEALAAIEEAVAAYRRLTEDNPTACLPNLATSLNNLSARLAETGRHAEALAAIEEAVAIHRHLVKDNPTAYLPNLATSLNNLSNRLAEVGQPTEGLATNEEAVGIHRRLAEDNPAAYLPNLATSLNNLSVRLAEVGRRTEGLAAIEEAVTIRRRLAQENPAAYLPNLATSLNNLSVRLAEVGRRTEGLAAIEEAVTIRRRLAQENPAAYQPDLAMSLNNLERLLRELGRNEEAEVIVQEARRLTETSNS